MPTYEYVCRSCDEHVEVVQKFTDEPLTTCDLCGGDLRKVIHASGILFKGSGFYSTDRKAALPMSRARNADSDRADSKDSSEKGSTESTGRKSEKADPSSAGKTKTDSKAGSKAGSKAESRGESKTKSEKSA